jgi:hypothetical protein
MTCKVRAVHDALKSLQTDLSPANVLVPIQMTAGCSLKIVTVPIILLAVQIRGVNQVPVWIRPYYSPICSNQYRVC